MSFQTETKMSTGIARRVSKSHSKWVLNKIFTPPIFGSKIQDQTIAMTTAGVIKGIKYTVLNHSEPFSFEFKIFAIINGIKTAKKVTDMAYTSVFVRTCLNTGSVSTAL